MFDSIMTSQQPANRTSAEPDRRQFVKFAGSAVAAGAVLTGGLPLARAAHNGVDETVKVGLVGCGGRGTAAAINARNADPEVKITALADAFADRIEQCRQQLAIEIPGALEVDDAHCFSGFDCHQQLIDSGVDVVLLCSPPYFRPMQMEAAVAAGKHIFCEKPVAVDAPGVRRVLAACEAAGEKGLNVVSGLCWRYHLGVRATMEKILTERAIGDIRAIEANYLTGELWHRGSKPEWSDMEYQIRNWLYFTWLSGDIPAEQHIHTLDKALWLMGDRPPVRCFGTGGRQKRTDDLYGMTYDHFATTFEWEGGVRCFSHCRQMNDCFSENECHVYGTQGSAHILGHIIENADGEWRYEGENPGMYDVEHEYLFRSIRAGEPINNGDYMCKSTLMAIMAREASYTGQEILWDAMWEDATVLGPAKLEWGGYDPGPVPVPGQRPRRRNRPDREG
jgi:predicted dehydrogenase